jgi:hypothetical protein
MVSARKATDAGLEQSLRSTYRFLHGGLHKLGVQFAQPRSTAVQYSNAIDFDRASLPSNAQIRAQTCLDDRHAPSSQRGGPKPMNFTPCARCLLTVC